MSQDFHHQHQGVFSFSNGFERSQPDQQIRRDKLRVPSYDQAAPLDQIGDESSSIPVYESAMLSEMFNFPAGGASTATELLENQILQGYRNRTVPSPDWFNHRQHHQISAINADSAAAMQLFQMNPPIRSSPSPSPSSNPQPTISTLNMLPPHHPSSSNPTTLQTLQNAPPGYFGHFTWAGNGNNSNPSEIQGVVEGQGLSLSLSSSLQAAKADGESGIFFSGGGAPLQFHGGVNHNHQLGASFGTVNILRNSKYAKAAQELLEEFCCVGRGQFKKNKIPKMNQNENPTADNSSSWKDIPTLSASDRLEHQRRKVKLLSMLDEVDRRYNHYCEQMQMVVNSFDMVMGFGAAVPYTCLAQKAMSRHFRCLKDAITAQLKHSCQVLGEKDAGASGVTKGETPRLRILEQSLRQQRVFHQMGMMEHEAWRPQRGLPERSVNILRAWLFEHFLHPYPSDADKHLLARQTGLSRNQVSNWFINARVRLWKPMVEEMYQQDTKDDPTPDQDQDNSSTTSAQTPSTTTAPPFLDNDASYTAMNAHCTFSDNQATRNDVAMPSEEPGLQHPIIRFGASSGDVSLTLGLRHAGNLPEKSPFSVRGFGGG